MIGLQFPPSLLSIPLLINSSSYLFRDVLKEEILKYKGVVEDAEDELSSFTPCPDFENSINADFEAAQGVLDLMEFRTASKFIDYIENCKGSVLISGIGNLRLFMNR